MFKFAALLAVVSIAFTVWCLVEAISADGSRTRNLPKVAWILVILLFPLLGSIGWLLAGRPAAAAASAASMPGPDRATRADRRNPAEEAADFSTRIRERAEEQRRRYEQQRKDKPEADQPEPDK